MNDSKNFKMTNHKNTFYNVFLVHSTFVWTAFARAITKSKTNEPIGFDITDSPNVILRRENEFIVDDPLRFVVQHCARVKLDNLVVFYRQIMSIPFQMGHLDNKVA